MEDGNDKSDTPTRLVERVHMQNKVDILDFSVQDHPLCILTAVLSASGRVILRAEKECSRTYLSLRLPVDSDSAFNQDADLNQANNISGRQYQRILIVSVVPLKIAVLQAAATLVLLDLRQYFVTSGLFAGTLPGKDISTLNSSKVKGFTDRKNTDKRGSFKAKLSLFELSDDSKREISADLSIEETINSISGLIEVIYSTETSLVSEGLEVQDIFYVGSNEKSVGGSQLLLKCGSSRFACIGLPESQSTDHNYHHFPEKQILSVDNPTGSNICVTNLSFFLLPKLLREEFGVLVWGVSDNGMTFVCPVDTSVTQVGQTEDNEYSNSKISEDFDASIWRDCGDEEEIATNTSNTIQKGKTRIRSVTGLKFSRDEVTILRPFSKTSDTSRSIIDCSDQLACKKRRYS